jgi:hypothetical protein
VAKAKRQSTNKPLPAPNSPLLDALRLFDPDLAKAADKLRQARKEIDRANAIRDNLIPPPWMKKPRRSPKAPKKKTQHKRLLELMRDLKLELGKLPREVRKVVVPRYKHKYNDEPSPSAVTRAYKEYNSSAD